jgi:antitoxin component of MazEF toxin-antitoxin module
VKSVYLLRVGKHGAWLRVPKSWLQKIGAKEGQKIRAWVKGNRLTVEIG